MITKFQNNNSNQNNDINTRDLTEDELFIIRDALHLPDDVIRNIYRTINIYNQEDIDKLIEFTSRPRIVVEFVYGFSNNDVNNVIEILCNDYFFFPEDEEIVQC